ncbi:MAG: nickel pincer cofactor biosynthesis protein LarB [Proteobacteria bacterium]|nr:MAG: nickel pincer cofactor biosynthesis protein LarB [Pseudomonadota bacterium]
MDRDRLRALFESVRRGDVDVDAALERLAHLPFVDTPHARVDTHRALRQGLPEVVYGPGKTAEQIAEVVAAQRDADLDVLVTRVDPAAANAVLALRPDGEYEPQGRLLWFGRRDVPVAGKGTILVVSAGTSDAPVACEAAGVARRYGNAVEMLGDVGVAGIHRLLASSEQLRRARVLIVVAGMEGALPSVVGGMVDKPVIAVPTSVGYGASLGGVAALLGMLTSCASNVCVVNIDNGFGAAHVATLINRI